MEKQKYNFNEFLCRRSSLKGDLHIHSKYSFDSIMDPRKILKYCKKWDFDIISITDHNSIKGSLEAQKYEKEFGINVIVGEEVKTDSGDIIGLNLNDELKCRSWIEVIEEIKNQGGICVFPHPFRGHKNIEGIASKVDIIEVFNSRSTSNENQMSMELVGKYNKPVFVGSDAHIYSEIGNAIMSFEDFYSENKSFYVNYAKKNQKLQSYIVRDIKLHNYYKIPFHVLKMLL